MTHKSTTIECNARESYILANATRFTSVIKLGSGMEHRLTNCPKWPSEEVEEAAARHRRGASVYAIGTSPEGLQVSVLAATYHPNKGWKYAEGWKAPADRKSTT